MRRSRASHGLHSQTCLSFQTSSIMVNATKGVFISCDIPMAQYIVNMNASLPASDKFIIHILDSTHMFVQPHVEQMIRSQIAKFREDNTYVKPSWFNLRTIWFLYLLNFIFGIYVMLVVNYVLVLLYVWIHSSIDVESDSPFEKFYRHIIQLFWLNWRGTGALLAWSSC